MGMDLGIADRIRAKGVRVVEVAGWQTRTTAAAGCVCLACLWHHTAGSGNGATPSLNVCIYGRGTPGSSDYLPGPLCQVLQSREPNPADDIAYVIAAGKANHAGQGQWGVASGNGETMGVEVEHVGTTTQPIARHRITAKIMAALLEGPGAARSGAAAARHAEYATPAGRKIDYALTDATVDAGWMRNEVGLWIGRTVNTPPVTPLPPEEEEDDDMAKVRRISIPPYGTVEDTTYAYVLRDDTIVDRDYDGTLIGTADHAKFDVILGLTSDEDTVTANQAQVDQVQSAIGIATRARYGL